MTSRGNNSLSSNPTTTNTTTTGLDNTSGPVTNSNGAAYTYRDDDQSTVFDPNDNLNNEPLSDTETLNTFNTFLSESDTIGDLQRVGYINHCPKFNSKRSLPFVSILLNKGFYCFSSEVSLKLYLQKKHHHHANTSAKKNVNKSNDFDFNNGLDIPLFHGVPINLVKSIFASSKNSNYMQIMKIYKYKIINFNLDTNVDSLRDNTDEVTPFITEEPTLISKNNDRQLYKFLFCVIYKQTSVDDSNRIIHHVVFNNNKSYKLVNYRDRKNSDTSLIDPTTDVELNLRWFGTTGFSSPFGSNNIKLLVLDKDMPSYINTPDINEFKRKYASTSHSMRPLGYLPVWARYSDDKATVIPRKRILRLADLDINETIPIQDNGINHVPWETQVLACMAMLLHDYESRKDKRHGNGNSSSLASSNTE
ncbi:hypothetical protein TBLA_0B00900 [Henningerozyma blattae CBS 6284]|uniref:Uncharacterized protein n=1 Tax=Henningerozyma blattae (strain ATCC 34711 / CBS 6284 / DSM 70876 / NBRC 10599 / NRRL Y-10934 / UCD 77-7) TaxID=1071380 RepID=I2GXT1_HENB6|nr:hypothetical protein TBLA_0B00900 [Tetrapisispora blattae CBS 6284]CCH58933.1 hypothetical protein TBLA_0B00900 [Tetrapisispora blattae CBS 6284]